MPYFADESINKKNEYDFSQQIIPITENFLLFNRLTNLFSKFSDETAERGKKFVENIKHSK